VIAAALESLLGPSSDHTRSAELLERLQDRFLTDGSSRGVTALKTEEAIYQEFILDSLLGASVLPDRGRVIDIGTGGGVPGLVLAIVKPDLQFVLTDSASKKTKWVSELVEQLGLQNVEVVTRRLELLGQEEAFRASFDAVTAKALAPLNVLSELALPLLKVNGRLLAYKGPALTQELKDAAFALQELGGRVHRCTGYRIGEKQFALCEILKFGNTPERYPRRDGVPQKKPLFNSRKN
jgi:16S rRNA (guanine527-N7)-methyltransferase